MWTERIVFDRSTNISKKEFAWIPFLILWQCLWKTSWSVIGQVPWYNTCVLSFIFVLYNLLAQTFRFDAAFCCHRQWKNEHFQTCCSICSVDFYCTTIVESFWSCLSMTTSLERRIIELRFSWKVLTAFWWAISRLALWNYQEGNNVLLWQTVQQYERVQGDASDSRRARTVTKAKNILLMYLLMRLPTRSSVLFVTHW